MERVRSREAKIGSKGIDRQGIRKGGYFIGKEAGVMSRKRCKFCFYWKRDRGDTVQGNCSNKKFVYDEATPIDGLRVWDYECYSAWFGTGEDFGCIHFKPRSRT